MPDNPRFEYAKAVVPADSPDDGKPDAPDAFSLAAGMFRELSRRIVCAADFDGELCLDVMRRAAGMTLDEIGDLDGISKVAVFKRLRKISRKHPELSAYLGIGCGCGRSRFSAQSGEREIVSRHFRNRRRLSAWIYRMCRL